MKRNILFVLIILILGAGCVAHDVTPVPQVDAAAGALVQMARADLAQRLGIDVATVTVADVTARDFSDSSLGVPQPGQVYTQVITPGYVIKLFVQGQEYTYHGSGSRVVLATVPTSTLPIARAASRRAGPLF